jgi:hypothetical protein
MTLNDLQLDMDSCIYMNILDEVRLNAGVLHHYKWIYLTMVKFFTMHYSFCSVKGCAVVGWKRKPHIGTCMLSESTAW